MIQYTKIISNERAQPNMNAPILRTLPIGTSLDVEYIGNGWARINRPPPLLASFIATSSLTDTNPNQTNWFSGIFTDTPTTTPAVTNYSIVTTPPAVPPPAKTKVEKKTTSTPAPAPPPEPEKNNTIWYVLGGAALIGIYYFFKKRK